MIYLGLGSNSGERRENIQHALQLLRQQGLEIVRAGPLLETPALLPPNAPEPWNYPFFNLVIEARAVSSPELLQSRIGQIYQQLGRPPDLPKAAPRTIDIDILLWCDGVIGQTERLMPYPQLTQRAFYLSSLLHLRPELKIPGQADKTLFEWSLELPHHHPLWMGIINLTPDSFSDGGRFNAWPVLEPHLDEMLAAGVHILDIGAESTRPGATPITADQEWQRLQPVFDCIREKLQGDTLRPRVSIDTYHPEVAAKALHRGADIINDVSGLTNSEMIAVARSSDAEWVAMHSLTVPADSQHTLAEDCDPQQELQQWLQRQLTHWDDAGLDLNRIIFDPGIGFGKNSLHSLQLLRHCGQFRRYGLRVLAGHSRKSYMRRFGHLQEADKDHITVGASLALCQQNVDIIRVHNIPAHTAAYRGWAHLQA